MWLVLTFVATIFAFGNVQDITPTNANIVDESPFVMVAFTIAGCGHCAALKPTWEELALLGIEGGTIASVDCDEHKTTLCGNIFSFPTLRVYRRGEMSAYTGKRTLEALHLFVDKGAGRAVRQVNTEQEHDFSNRDSAAVIVATSACSESKLAAANDATDRQFFFLQQTAAAESYSVELRRGAEVILWDNVESLDAFVTREAHPLVAPYDKFVHSTSGRPLVILFHDSALEDIETTLEAVKTAARGTRDSNLLFCSAHTDVWDGKRIGLTSYPAIALVETDKLNIHYAYPNNEFNGAALLKWLQQYLAKELSRTRVSLALPSGEDEHTAVRTVVSDNFEQVVYDNDKDVLVYFRSDYCGSSKRFDSEWTLLVSRLKDMDAPGLRLGVADGWANDWPDEVQVVGLPDIRLFPADEKKESKRFHGDRTAENIIKWMQPRALHPITETAADKEL